MVMVRLIQNFLRLGIRSIMAEPSTQEWSYPGFIKTMEILNQIIDNLHTSVLTVI